MSNQIYILQNTNPFQNLAVENHFFQKLQTNSHLLILWQNKPSIIMGRAQNPFIECNLSKIQKDNIPLVRRQSGGGTVYHDLGNLNFTFMSSKPEYCVDQHFEILLKALNSLNINAYRTKRNDIFVSHMGSEFKISGNAFRETKDKAFHHGTLLFNSDLTKLTNYLKPKGLNIEAKGVKSVRSSVINLSDINPGINFEILSENLAHAFNQYHHTDIPIKRLDTNDLSTNLGIQADMEKLLSWEWRFGKTLPFTQVAHFQLNGVDVRIDLDVKHMKLANIIIKTKAIEPARLTQLETDLLSVRLCKVELDQKAKAYIGLEKNLILELASQFI